MFKDKVIAMINERKKLHPNDDFKAEEYRVELIKILSQSEERTINLLDNCDKDEALWISEVFEEVAYNLKSEKYIECLERICKKYPDLNLDYTVNEARDFMIAALEEEK